MKTITTPRGTYGKAIELWGERFAVAADWAKAGSPVMQLGEDGWISTGWQVGHYSHNAYAALQGVVARSMRDSGDNSDDVAERASDLVLTSGKTFSIYAA